MFDAVLASLYRDPPRSDEGPHGPRGWPCCTLVAELSLRLIDAVDDVEFSRSHPTSQWWRDANIWAAESPWSPEDAAAEVVKAQGRLDHHVYHRSSFADAQAMLEAMENLPHGSWWWIQKWDELTTEGHVPTPQNTPGHKLRDYNGHSFYMRVDGDGLGAIVESTIKNGLKVNGKRWDPSKGIEGSHPLLKRLTDPEYDVSASLVFMGPRPTLVPVHDTTPEPDMSQPPTTPTQPAELLGTPISPDNEDLLDLLEASKERTNEAFDRLARGEEAGVDTLKDIVRTALGVVKIATPETIDSIIDLGTPTILALIDDMEDLGGNTELMLKRAANKRRRAAEHLATVERWKNDGKAQVFEKLRSKAKRNEAADLIADAEELEAQVRELLGQ